MRKLLSLLLVAAVACNKEDDPVQVEEPTVKKIEWQLHASEAYTEPWLDAMTARVQVRVYKTDTVKKTMSVIWDTTFAARALRQYPVLPQKHTVKKEVSLLRSEKLQSWYNIRHEMDGRASEKGYMQMLRDSFTFVDIRL